MSEYKMQLTFIEFCRHSTLSTQTVVEFVEHGILEPQGETQESWMFAIEMVPLTRTANRLKRDLGLNWAGVALALDLLSQREALRSENQQLRNQLQRFLLQD